MLVLAGAFGMLDTAHVALFVALLRRPPRWRAIVALVVPPLAPFWGWEARQRFASAVWVFALLVYGLAVTLAAI